mgnify:CR=1 FL=1
MKRLNTILALVLGAVALTSCNKDLHGPEAYFSDGEIIFGSRGVLVETKAFTETTNDVLQASGFGVAAVFDSDNSVMFNAAVAYNSTDGVYRGSNRYYYPSTGTVSFYGVYPSSQAITLTSGVATLAYTQNADTDLVGVAVKNVAKQNNPVQMDFEHLLSQVTVQCKGYDANVDYKVTSISIKNANGGTYAYADDSWTRSSTLADYSYLSTATAVASDAMTSVGSPMSFVPGDIDLTIAWKCYNKGTETVVSENEETVSTTIAKGKHTSINLTLPSNASEVTFVTSVGGWIAADENISLVPDALMAVNAAAGETVTISALDIASGTKGSVDWGDGTKEPFSNEGTKSSVAEDKITFSHTYAAAFTGEAKIFVEEGNISGKVCAEELSQFTIENSEKFDVSLKYTPSLVSGLFTINDSGKTVKFTKGNLYWNGNEFRCEENQYDCITAWDDSHVEYFFWSKDARVAYASDYSAANTEFGITPAETDIFFSANGEVFEGFTVLSKAEWDYLINNHVYKNICTTVKRYDDALGEQFIGTYEQAKVAFQNSKLFQEIYKTQSFDELFEAGIITASETIYRNVAGIGCVILIPNGFDGIIKETYTASEWTNVESNYGIVALPLSGDAASMYISLNSYGIYWALSNGGYPDRGDCVYFCDSTTSQFGEPSVNTGNHFAFQRYPVRLVQVQ